MSIGVEELVARLGAGIESTPDACDGAARIVGTRIAVWMLEKARRAGSSEADLLRDHPELRAVDLVNAWTHVATHPAEIESRIRAHEGVSESIDTVPSKSRSSMVVRTPGVCGGAARIEGTRIPIWQLVEERNEGATESRLLNSHRTLSARDLVAAWDYAEAHAEEIASEIRRNAMAT